MLDYSTHAPRGGFYGSPYSYIGGHEDPRTKPQRPDLVNKAMFGAHMAVLDVSFYTGSRFPAQYRRWRGPRISRLLKSLAPASKDAWGRPVAVFEIHDGGLLISDDSGRKIWRVT